MKPEMSSSLDTSADDSDGAKPAFASQQLPRLASRELDFLSELQTQPLLGSRSPELERARMREGQRAAFTEFAVVHQTFQTSSCPVHILRSREAVEPLPMTFYLHGGGWTLGDLTTHTKLVSELAIQSQSAVIFIDYPLAPEHRYPAPLEACIQAIEEVLSQAPSLGLDRRRAGFIGDSSGGNLCMGYALLARERKLWLPKTQVLLYPAVDASLSLRSQTLFAENPNLGRYTMEWFWNNYAPDASTRKLPVVSPLAAPAEAFAGLPPTLIVSCEYDILRDEAEQLAARLVEAGVEVIAVRWLGALHGFVVNEALSSSMSARACIRFVAQHLATVYSEQG